MTLPHCQAQVGGRQGLIFIGPRIKMGIYEGIPTRIAPHTTTGSADYFGPLVNRYTVLLMRPLGTCVCVCVCVLVCLSVCLCVMAQSIADSMNYFIALASPTGMLSWQILLASPIGKPHWQAPFIGKSHWQVPLASPTGKPYCLLLGSPKIPAPCFCTPDLQKAWLLTQA